MRPLCITATLVLLAACKQDTDVAVVDTAPETFTVALPFKALIDGIPVNCRSQYEDVGATNTRVRVGDMRMYIHDVSLIDEAGTAVPVELDQDAFQRDNVVLLDFETGESICTDGTAETHTEVTGTVPGGSYTGVRFTVGLPFELNHVVQEAGVTPAPFDLAPMYRSVTAGYRFFKLNLTSEVSALDWPVYVGSTGCSGFESDVTCTSENLQTFTVTNFDWRSDTVVFALDVLLETTDLSKNSTYTVGTTVYDTPDGCQSDPSDADCAGIFSSYGLGGAPKAWVHKQ